MTRKEASQPSFQLPSNDLRVDYALIGSSILFALVALAYLIAS
jgi:hypothetical protein